MSLDRASAVQIALGLQVSLVGKLWCFIDAQVSALATCFYGRHPLQTSASANPSRNPKKSSSAFPALAASVLRVCCPVYVSQICKAVIGTIAVDVVNLCFRPLACHVKKRETVSIEAIFAKADGHVTKSFVHATNEPALRRSVKTGGALWKRPERADFWIVVNKLAQTLRGKIGLSHEALQLLIGQRPAAIRSRLRASLFSQLSLGRAS